MHSWLCVVAAYVPLLQAVAEVAPAKQKWPAGHALHSALLLSPLALLCVPGGHGSAAEAPGAQYEPGGQTWHSVLPLSFMNFPASHPTQVPCLDAGCTVPGAHRTGAALPTVQNVPASQSTHWSALVITLSDAFSCVPAGHGSGALDPSTQ